MNPRTRKLVPLLLIGAVVAAAGCSEKEDEEKSPKASIRFEVLAKWEGEHFKQFNTLQSCTVSAEAENGTEEACLVQMEEARLYFSDLRFRVSTEAAEKCEVVEFQPYFYKRSNETAFIPFGETSALDCSTEPAPRKCYGGAAPVLLGDKFPSEKSARLVTRIQSSRTLELPSENRVRWYNGEKVNLLVTNDLADRESPIPSGVKAYAGQRQFSDYKVSCLDRWGEPLHSLIIMFRDQDRDEKAVAPSETGPVRSVEDQYSDWSQR